VFDTDEILRVLEAGRKALAAPILPFERRVGADSADEEFANQRASRAGSGGM
jgi:hypothetical protein